MSDSVKTAVRREVEGMPGELLISRQGGEPKKHFAPRAGIPSRDPVTQSHHLLPTRHGGAAENMARDFLMLQRYPEASHPRFRHYGWHRPAMTFGYSQKIAFIRNQLVATDGPLELCRRFTGGGLVDHREDWTYALVIPRGHPLECARAIEAYRTVHEKLAQALRDLGQPAETKQPFEGPPAALEQGPTGVCFVKAECHDVIVPGTGVKIAGAAQKRNKHGLILQGSIWRPAAPAVTDWDAFLARFSELLGDALGASPQSIPWPDFNEDELERLTETYASAEWTEQR